MKKTFAVRLPNKQLTTLKEIANAEERSVSAIIRRMIDDGIKKKEKESTEINPKRT